ncbi:MAG: orotidine-5'-phosphate decarboxylase [Chromatiaceae bacterium]
MHQEPRVIVALDFPAEAPALALADRLDPGRCRLKVGKELFTRLGPGFVERLAALGFQVFLDLKFHDIPSTAAAAGRRMMDAARERLAQCANPPLLIAVTVLTSLDASDLAEIGCPGEPAQRVLRLARLTRDAGLDGVVCSPQEAAMVRREVGGDFVLVTPGVRPASAAVGDQKRVMTPSEAVQAGADYLVVGRPITAAPDPLQALASIEHELGSE